ncbi:gas vesicle protein GvpN, partial [Fictibacillus sp. NRS-1165]
EFTRSKPSTNNIFLSILEERILPLYGTKQQEPFIRVHPKFSVMFTSNPAEYAGVHQTQDALLDRLITIPIDYSDEETEAEILSKKTGVSKEKAAGITRIVSSLREKCPKNSQHRPSLRASLMIATLAHEEGIPVDGKDEDFQQLCFDILWFSVSKGLDESDQSKIKNIVEDTCKEIERE